MAIPGGAYGIYSGYNMKAGGDRLTGRDEKKPDLLRKSLLSV